MIYRIVSHEFEADEIQYLKIDDIEFLEWIGIYSGEPVIGQKYITIYQKGSWQDGGSAEDSSVWPTARRRGTAVHQSLESPELTGCRVKIRLQPP